MTDNVVHLPRRDEGELVWACDCGSTTHYHHADGRVTCGSCDVEASGASGSWRARLPEEPIDPRPLDHDNFKVTDFTGPDVFLKRQIKTSEGRPMAAAIIVFHDGSFSTWQADIETDEQKAWLLRKLADAGVRMTGRR